MASIEHLKNAQGVKIIDVRKKPDDMQIPGSIRYNGDALETSETLPFSKDEQVVLYCGSGNSCARIARTLREKGFANAQALDGGYAAWKDAGLPLEPISEVREVPAG